MDDEQKLAENDHRRLGKELDLFVFSDLVGAGLPLFTPRGTLVRDELLHFSEELQAKNGFERVFTPHITKDELYKQSGHWDKFGEELFLVKSQETSDKMVLKPMNCPHHIQIYASRPRSYRELPIRYMESTVQYRDEKKGELAGLARVRAISIDDAHIFCRLDQIEEEFKAILKMVEEMYAVFAMSFRARLSFRDDSDAYLGGSKQWKIAQEILEKVAKKLGLKYDVAVGDAAFYGPKIDIMITDSLGREWQCATEQLDFNQPQRFGLTYIDADGKEKPIVLIHKALLGSVERFLSVYLEHTGGHLPVWLSPEQLRIATLNDEKPILKLAESVVEKARILGLRVTLDNSNETVSKKVLQAEQMKVPYVIVVGNKELESGKVTPRVRTDLAKLEPGTMNLDAFLEKVAEDAKARK
ncbi:TPA: threonine--tRNA ligase [Candidatus Saccharibacteria bacterium]|nr:MAG: threonine--tRNA ligase [Candidatus Saccharibacteria bacterium RIFCSPHIGHO2_12_FULL_47_17]HCM51810.1 threonine--tRNA ligase [Candidatus Saccharibacteria bacterium]